MKTTQQPGRSDVNPEPVQRSLERFAAAFNEGHAEEARGWYAEDAIWVLTNGTRLEGGGAIDGFVVKATLGGAGGMTLSSPAVQVLGDVAYVDQRFGFAPKPGARVEGRRVALLSRGDAARPWRVRRDVWLPAEAPEGDVAAELRGRLQALARSINQGDAEALRGLYAEGASVVLSNGAVFGGATLPGFLEKTAASGITDMAFEPVSFSVLGDKVAQSTTRFSVTVPRPGHGPVTLQGERVVIWRRSGEQWVIDLELSWPRT